MFDIKARMEPEKWLNNYTELTSMYCYVFNSFTWDFNGMGMDKQDVYFEKLKPCIQFLIDAIYYEELCCENDEDFMDTKIDLLEVYTTLEILFCMGNDDAYNVFLSHKQID